MKWLRMGCVFGRSDFSSWTTHAQVPTPLLLDDRIRVYFSARNESGKSFTTFLDLERENPTKIIDVRKDPILPFGAPGTFDDEGIMPGFVFFRENKVWLYYSGWNQRVSVPYHNSTGLAVSHDNGETFSRLFDGPILERTPMEPYLAVTPTILKSSSGYDMWYISGLRWIRVEDKFEPVYVIKHARSSDGIKWERDGLQSIPSLNDEEAFSHPTVFKDNEQLLMYFCYRQSRDYRNGSGAYRIGSAFSIDGVSWTRNAGEVTFEGEIQDWESKMRCYPYILQTPEADYLFYNGNGFGQSGFGVAKRVG